MKTKKIAIVSASALTAGLAHGQVVTNSEIIYTSDNVLIPNFGAGGSFDLNEDGLLDYQIHFNGNYSNKPYVDTTKYDGQSNYTPFVLTDANGNLPLTTNGTPIGSSYGQASTTGYFYKGGSTGNGGWESGGTNIDGYVGLEMTDAANNTYYGWVQCIYNSTNVDLGVEGTITVVDYAFDQTPGETILAGQNAPPGTAPQIAVTPPSMTNGVLATVQFTVQATGNPYPTYQWLAATNGAVTYTPLTDGGPITGSQSNVLTITGVVPGFTGAYSALVANSSGSTNSVPAALTISPLIINGLTPSPLEILPGPSASITVSYSSSQPILLFQWLKNGEPLSNGTKFTGVDTSSLGITNLIATDGGNYSVIVSNLYGAVTSAVDQVTIISPNSAYQQEIAWTLPYYYFAFDQTNDPAAGSVPAVDYIGGNNGTYGVNVQNGNSKYGIAGPNPAGGFPGFAATNSAVSIVSALQALSSLVVIPPLNLNTNTATFTAWINPQTTEPNYATVLSYRSAVAGTANGINYTTGSLSGTANVSFGYHWNDTYESYWWSDGDLPQQNLWTFVALVIQPNSAAVYTFDNVNGMVAGTNNFSSVVQAIATPGMIGGDINDANFIGYIDEVAVYKYALSEQLLTNLWTAAVTGVATVPSVSMSISQSGGNVTISWLPPIGKLLQAPTLLGPWTTNTSASSPYQTTPSAAALFYQVTAP
jgi:hypothetical protein